MRTRKIRICGETGGLVCLLHLLVKGVQFDGLRRDRRGYAKKINDTLLGDHSHNPGYALANSRVP
jgi:hypothetical protein